MLLSIAELVTPQDPQRIGLRNLPCCQASFGPLLMAVPPDVTIRICQGFEMRLELTRTSASILQRLYVELPIHLCSFSRRTMELKFSPLGSEHTSLASCPLA